MNDKELIDRYLSEKFKESTGTFRNAKSIIEQCLKYIKKPLLEIDYDDLYLYLDKIIDKKKIKKTKEEINKNTKESYRYNLSAFFKYCERYYKRKKIDFYGVVPNAKEFKFTQKEDDLKDPTEIKTKVLSDKELEKIMDYVYLDKNYKKEQKRIRDFLLIIIAITTGARISEIRTIQTKHIDLENRFFTTGHIKNARKSTLGKEKALLFFFPESIQEYLEVYLDMINDSKFLFPRKNNKNKHISNGVVVNLYQKIRKKIKIYFSWHYFRKTLITRRANMGILPWQSEGLMNHAPSSVEGESYIKLSTEEKMKLYDDFYPYSKMKYIGDKKYNC